jgi:Spy/CpxP family protein refolding chaperone
MRLTKWMAWGLLASSLSVAACSGAEAGPAASAGQPASADPVEGAELGLVREALEKVALRPDQKAEVERLTAAAKVRHEAVHAARVALRNAIADQVLAGKIDRAALKPQIDALLAAIDAARPDDRAAIVRLHDLLDSSQRGELVATIESSFRAKREARKGHGGPRQWAADLNLTDAQRDQLRAVLREQFHHEGDGPRQWQAGHEEGRRLLQSFREEKFALDGRASMFGRDRIEHGTERMLGLAEAALPILKPEQRAIAAQKIREGRH